jgi:hypothetical protein
MIRIAFLLGAPKFVDWGLEGKMPPIWEELKTMQASNEVDIALFNRRRTRT